MLDRSSALTGQEKMLYDNTGELAVLQESQALCRRNQSMSRAVALLYVYKIPLPIGGGWVKKSLLKLSAPVGLSAQEQVESSEISAGVRLGM